MKPKPGIFYKLTVFGKEKHPCEILFSFLVWKVIRFQTSWDNGAFSTWRTRIKLFWNVEEVES